MEIKNVEEEPIKEYPTQDEVSNTKLRKSIPKTWKKIGLTSMVIGLLIKIQSVSNAVSTDEIIQSIDAQSITLDGVTAVQIPIYAKIIGYAILSIPFISIIGILISTFSILRTRFINKKENTQNKVKKSIKVLLIVSTVLLLLSTILLLFAYLD